MEESKEYKKGHEKGWNECLFEVLALGYITKEVARQLKRE